MHYIPQFLNGAQLQQAHQYLSHATWADGRASAGSLASQVKNNSQILPNSEASASLQSLVQAELDKSAPFMAIALPKKLSNLGFNRYSQTDNGAEFYGQHVDNAIRFNNELGQRMRTDVSCTLFLSDPSSYSGGELVIQDGLVEHGVKLAAGDMLLYPSSTIHQVKPVTHGARLACFFWVESMIRSNEQRHLLLDLDTTIRSLREQHGDSKEVLSLTAIYHNLLRQWLDS